MFELVVIFLAAIILLVVWFRQPVPENAGRSPPSPSIPERERALVNRLASKHLVVAPIKISPTKTVIFHPSESRHLSSPSVLVATDRWFLPEDFVVFDLETTGFSPKTAEIIEIGAIRISRDFSRRESFQTILKIEGSLPRKITQITGITRKMINSEGMDPKEAVQKFADFIGDLPVVAYNVSFDQSFILPAAAACGIKLRNDFDCALKKARLAWPDRTSYKLVDIARDAQLSDEGTHRALGDARRALIVYAAAMTILHSADRSK